MATIMAIVTTSPAEITGGGVPVFRVQNREELEVLGKTFEKIFDASAFEVKKDTIIIVNH